MNRFILSCILCTLGMAAVAQSLNPTYVAYIHQYRDMAIEQQRKHQVPAAITMAQGLLESAAGQSELAMKANNHFGVKCTSEWVGRTIYKDDDTERVFSRLCRGERLVRRPLALPQTQTL